ncbi:unnamed protein product [Adineta ricciae]|uniref:Folate receptor-like domain-containing protein n=1 Tax=Adineta ricciae TaxID=249248 RepID=A0A813RIS5_ADIRI|nr:unnamed protein product [Adineta ricciae]
MLLSDTLLLPICVSQEIIAILIILLSSAFSPVWTHNSSLYTVSSQSAPYCSFFSNRAPSPQPALTNCTWFQENSCCRENEVRHIFSQVRPLIGSSAECSQFLNILMCYVCSPLQYHFYRSERLHVCSSYCDRMYKACATALMKGIPVGELYANGREFCLSRRFEISDISNSSSCFSDDYGSVTTKQIKNSNSNLSSTNIERPNVNCLPLSILFITIVWYCVIRIFIHIFRVSIIFLRNKRKTWNVKRKQVLYLY